MALRLLRLRRTLTPLSSTLHRPLSTPIAIVPPAAQSPPIISQVRVFTGTRVSMMSTTARPEKKYKLYEDGDEITEDTILFPGCDYNHWLITVDFPKEEPKPSPEEMVATYERLCAQGLNISIEEAKKRIYACSTTTYQGFQVLMSEQESERFKDVPGVVFVLPDSYIDPVNKEYGGDKYENGVITPRPPPVHRGGDKRHERNRSPPRFNQQGGPMPNHQGPPPQHSQQGHMQGGPMPNHQGPPPQYSQPGHMQGGGSNYGPQQNYPPQQNHGPPGPCGRMPMNNRDYATGGRNMYQGQQGNHYPPGQQGYNQGHHGNHYPPGQQGYNQGQQRNHYPLGQQGYSQGQQGNHYAPDQRSFPQGDRRDHGSPGQRDYRGGDRNYSPTHAGNYGQGGNTGYGQRHPDDGQRSAQMEQRSMKGEQGNYAPIGQPGLSDLVRHSDDGQRSAQMEQRRMQGEQGTYAPIGQPGWSDQVRHSDDGQRSAQMEQRRMQGEQGNYAPIGQPGRSDQVRHSDDGLSAQMEQRSMQGEQWNYAPIGQPGWSDQVVH